MPADQLVVQKFGGTSVASAERYRAVANIVLARPEARRAVVVSAMIGEGEEVAGYLGAPV
jgi:aspartokinase/homoserine dehydrogenase 1